MAATSAPRPPPGLIDPLKGMKYSIQLGDSISKKQGHGQFVSVKYNHKPKHTSSTQKTTITSTGDKYNLVIADDNSPSSSRLVYKYQGTLDPHTTSNHDPQSYSYALVHSQEKNAFVLERVSTDLHFNMISNPGKASTSQLAQQYTQLDVRPDPEQADEEDELFQDGASYKSDSDASVADEDNPYDYRHFLPNGKYAQAKERTDMSRSQSPNLGGSSPYLGGQSPNPNGYLSATSPALKPKPKISRPLPTKPAPRSSATAAATKPKPISVSKANKPRIASPPHIVEDLLDSPPSSESDSDSDSPRRSKSKSKAKTSSSDLIIDLGSPPPQAKRKPLPRLKNAKKGGPPISFREATSASENEGDADESGLEDKDIDAEGELDADYEMDDEDVEIFKLPSPARVQDNPQRSSGDAVGLGLDSDIMDEEDDLAAALTMELEKDVAAQGQAQQEDEESEVSEEE